jgi:hypothetical protein
MQLVKPEVKRPRHRWDGCIEVDFKERHVRVWRMRVSQDRDPWQAVVNTVMSLLFLTRLEIS